MKKEDVDEVINYLGDERRIIHYYDGRYCLDNLNHFFNKNESEKLSIKSIKSSPLNKYLKSKSMVDLLRRCGNGWLNKEDLKYFFPEDYKTFVMTLGSWGNSERGWDQTSRNQSNLVLQINFDNSHYQSYKKLVKPTCDYGPFEYWGHPVCQGNRKTLAWIRLDIELKTGEVLIEEIQNDWLRKSIETYSLIKKHKNIKPEINVTDVIDDIQGSYDDIESYTQTVLKPYYKLWTQLCMTIAIEFIRKELCCDSIYYHSYDTGKRIKNVPGNPPKSLYTQLPKQFDFKTADSVPAMLLENKFSKRCIKAIKNPKWFKWQEPALQ